MGAALPSGRVKAALFPEKSFLCLHLHSYCWHRKASVQRAARALLSGLGEQETQTFLFYLTNSCSFQGRFSSAHAGERQTCRGMMQTGRQQIDQAELPMLAHKAGRRGHSCSCWACNGLGEELARQTRRGNVLPVQSGEKAED